MIQFHDLNWTRFLSGMLDWYNIDLSKTNIFGKAKKYKNKMFEMYVIHLSF